MVQIVESLVADAQQNGDFRDVSAEGVKASLEDAYRVDPQAAATTSHSGQTYLEIANLQWKRCTTGNNPDGGDPDSNRYGDCRSLIQNLWAAFGINQTPDFLPAIRDAIEFSENHLLQNYADQLLDDLRALG
jgi:hypothetical protein